MNLASDHEALELDRRDGLAEFRHLFHVPKRHDGEPVVYLCGHSLGLPPIHAETFVRQELWDWQHLGVDAHFRGKNPWYSYHEQFAGPLARLVGSEPDEVVAMNGLTVNLHLMLATFYKGRPERAGILIDEPTFPSDRYAVESVLRLHDFDPRDWLLAAEDVEKMIETRGHEIAVVVISAVNFLTGRFYDVAHLAKLAHAKGCIFGVDLAHAIGNVPLRLHEWGVDFAVWCSYKYLNSGPGAVAGCFVHQKHGHNPELPRPSGWWGNDPKTRFRMHLEPHFIPKPGADGWQLSNPPIFSMAPLRASLELFDKAGIEKLREKSEKLTHYLEMLLDRLPKEKISQLTPRDVARRGAMLALRIHEHGKDVFKSLEEQGIVADFREPDVIRVAPTPLYNSFHDVWRFAAALGGAL
jgi:kynureninase